MSIHLTEHEHNRRKAWVNFFISAQQLSTAGGYYQEHAAQQADTMLKEYDKRFKCPYAMEHEDFNEFERGR